MNQQQRNWTHFLLCALLILPILSLLFIDIQLSSKIDSDLVNDVAGLSVSIEKHDENGETSIISIEDTETKQLVIDYLRCAFVQYQKSAAQMPYDVEQYTVVLDKNGNHEYVCVNDKNGVYLASKGRLYSITNNVDLHNLMSILFNQIQDEQGVNLS